MGLYAEHIYPRVINRMMDTKVERPIRARVCAPLAGEVVEVGFGTGHNLPYLPPAVTRLRAVEPSARSVRLAGERIAATPVPVDIVGLEGQRLPLDDASADAVLCTWSLCSIPDPVAAVREMRRVLRPGGALHFVEHGLAPEPGVRRWQRRLNPLQRRLGCGCELDRDIPRILAAGGMRPSTLDSHYVQGGPRAFCYMYEGTAVPDTA